MKQITAIGNENDQKMKIVMSDGTEFDLVIQYKAQQTGWLISLTHNGKTISNIRVTTSGNFLYQWRNIFPFGLACTVDGDQEPLLQQDFFSGRAKMYVLTREEVINYAKVISGEISA